MPSNGFIYTEIVLDGILHHLIENLQMNMSSASKSDLKSSRRNFKTDVTFHTIADTLAQLNL